MYLTTTKQMNVSTYERALHIRLWNKQKQGFTNMK